MQWNLNRLEMRSSKVLRLALVLFFALPCFANKSIAFKGHWNADVKSINPQFPIQTWIEDNNKNLLLEFSYNIGVVNVIIINSEGKEVCSQSVDTKSMSSAIISLEEEMKQGDLLTITDGENIIYGYIFIN